MKYLGAKPHVPPYLHLGAVCLELPPGGIRGPIFNRKIFGEWQLLSGRLLDNKARVDEIMQRLDKRHEDPHYSDGPFEVFYTVTEIAQGQVRIDYYY